MVNAPAKLTESISYGLCKMSKCAPLQGPNVREGRSGRVGVVPGTVCLTPVNPKIREDKRAILNLCLSVMRWYIARGCIARAKNALAQQWQVQGDNCNQKLVQDATALSTAVRHLASVATGSPSAAGCLIAWVKDVPSMTYFQSLIRQSFGNGPTACLSVAVDAAAAARVVVVESVTISRRASAPSVADAGV